MDTNHYQVLSDYLSNNTNLSQREIESLLQLFRKKILKSNEVFIEKGTQTKWVGFIVDGMLKAVNPRENKREEIHYFLPKGIFFSERSGYYQNKHLSLSIVASKRTTLLYISIETINRLKNENSEMKALIHQLGENTMNYISCMQSMLSFSTKKERIALFKEYYPQLVKVLKKIQIARFLNVSYSYYLHNSPKNRLI